MRKVHPPGHRVLVKVARNVAENISKGGIVMAKTLTDDERQRSTQEATVLELGPQAYKDYGDGEPWCAVGDDVLIPLYSGQDTTHPITGDIHRMINDGDVWGVLGEDDGIE